MFSDQPELTTVLTMNIGPKLRTRLADLKMSQAAAARELGLSARRFNHYVTDQREADYALIARICVLLRTHPNYLFGFDENPELNPDQSKAIDRIISELTDIKMKLSNAEDNE